MYTLNDLINQLSDSQITTIKRTVTHDGLQEALVELATHQALFTKSVLRISQRLVTESALAIAQFSIIKKD